MPSITAFKETNKIFSQYNDNTADISQKFSKFHYIHRLELGARYMLSQHLAIDAGFISLFQQTMHLPEIFPA
ncbi:MAG: hypothetical protein IPN29_21000 [Saprospiraceae bacterium]|nr:hypothetical protein [Saprospiraceae bacterium]